ncbi:MAG: lipocalin family protein [Clostridiales bacterium]|jgi:hypothetical protein|nr:lipocalin family protein [Clostridiales bacterium]
MKRQIKLIATIVCTVAALTVLTSCIRLSEEEKALVGTYNLTEFHIDELPYIDENTYEYSWVKLTDKKKYEMENKANGTTINQEGKWSAKDGVVTIKTKVGAATSTEKYKIEDGKLIIEGQTMLNGVTYNVRLVFTKFVETEEEA